MQPNGIELRMFTQVASEEQQAVLISLRWWKIPSARTLFANDNVT